MEKHEVVKEELKYDDMTIRLYQPIQGSKVRYESISNISAFNKSGDLIWKAERPKSHKDQFWSMWIDQVKKVLTVNSVIGYRYIINFQDGKIIDYYIVK